MHLDLGLCLVELNLADFLYVTVIDSYPNTHTY